MAGHVSHAQRAVEGLILLPPRLFQCGILLEKSKGFGIGLMSVQIKAQLQKHEFQGLQLTQRAADRIGGVLFQMEGQIQAGEESAVAEGVGLVVALGIGLLEGNIRHRQGRALRQSAAAIGTDPCLRGGGLIGIGIGIQCLFLLIVDGRGENSSGVSYAFRKKQGRGEYRGKGHTGPVFAISWPRRGCTMKKAGWKKILAIGLAGVIVGTGILGSLHQKKTTAVFAPVRLPGQQLILDAGHGGEDGGAVSLTGVAESNINLAVVLRLDQLLGFYGIAPILIRDSDVSIYDPGCETLRQKKVSDLQNRVALIEAAEDPVVISIHQNTFSNSAYHGAQVFFRAGEESEALAELVQSALREGVDPENKRTPTKIPDSVYLMKHITCPAVLVECGFLSNSAEEKKLRSGEYQTQLAICITSAWLRSDEISTGNGTEPVI